jgi:hypothetical protein
MNVVSMVFFFKAREMDSEVADDKDFRPLLNTSRPLMCDRQSEAHAHHIGLDYSRSE